MKNKYVFVAGLHGNEKMPVKALQDTRVDFVLGNPAAYKKSIRFTEHDLNASFGKRNKQFESIRAKEILRKIPNNAIVIDFHTTESEERPFVIVVDRHMLKIAKKTGIKKVVVMKHSIKKGHALINYRKGISVEAGTHKSLKSYSVTKKVVESLKEQKDRKIEIYEVYGVIKKPGKYQNFKTHPLGFIPVLANEKAYEKEGIYGLKAKRIK